MLQSAFKNDVVCDYDKHHKKLGMKMYMYYQNVLHSNNSSTKKYLMNRSHDNNGSECSICCHIPEKMIELDCNHEF